MRTSAALTLATAIALLHSLSAEAISSCQKLGLPSSNGVCGSSRINACESMGDVTTAAKPSTWHDASDLCSSLGARLCSLEELIAGCGAGTGQGLDHKRVWTSTPCDDSCHEGLSSCTPQYHWGYQLMTKPPKEKRGSTPSHVMTPKKGKKCLPTASNKKSTAAYTRCCADLAGKHCPTHPHCSAQTCDDISKNVYCGSTNPETRAQELWMCKFHFTCETTARNAEGTSTTVTNPDVCAGTKINDCRYKCHKEQSFAQANKICTNAGMRLCTQNELLSGAGRDASDGDPQLSCGFDAHEVWSSTVCGSVTKNPSRVRVTYDRKAGQCRAVGNAFGYVRCCANAAPEAAYPKKEEGKHKHATYTILIILCGLALLVVCIVFTLTQKNSRKAEGIDALFELRNRNPSESYFDDPERDTSCSPGALQPRYTDEAPGEGDGEAEGESGDDGRGGRSDEETSEAENEVAVVNI